MKQYLDACRYVMENGIERKDRTGTGTKSCFGQLIQTDCCSKSAVPVCGGRIDRNRSQRFFRSKRSAERNC